MEDVIYSAIGQLVDIVSYRMLPCTITTYSPALAIDRRHGDRALPVPAADGAKEEAPREDIPVVPLVYDVIITVLYWQAGIRRSLATLGAFERHTNYIARMMHDMWEQVQDLREAIGLPCSAPPMPRASTDRSAQKPPCPPMSTNMPTLAGTAAPPSAAVERLTLHTGAIEEDPATTGEATPVSVVVRPIPTTEDDTTVAVEVSSTSFADIDKIAGQRTPLKGAIEDHPPTEKDPASTVEGDTTAPAEVSPTAFNDVDEAAR
ncbi:hypothetical protein E2562_035211 [Oryza meyeriana var. granulata]|uniref:Uncharacterized protein n=1 Tax=Oryza meyeriana var. granulata TaxID=110450 RepID=A0A6G1DSS1_9ORYZ|nr:hypothetical protein E2562_035211 [Oryza meyeriana var. granulata]